jgi:hypothetical protein
VNFLLLGLYGFFGFVCFWDRASLCSPTGLELTILPQPPQCWDYRYVPLHPDSGFFGLFGLVWFWWVFGGTGVWTQGFVLVSRYSTTWAILPVHFALVVLEIGSRALFAGLAWNLSPPILDFQAVRITSISHQGLALCVIFEQQNNPFNWVWWWHACSSS